MKVGEMVVAWISLASTCLFVLCIGQLETVQITCFVNM